MTSLDMNTKYGELLKLTLFENDTFMESITYWVIKHLNKNLDQVKAIDFLDQIFQNKYILLRRFTPGTQIIKIDGTTWNIEGKFGSVEGFSSRPKLTPDMMLRLGVFGGTFIYDMIDEIPLEWILMALVEGKISLTGRPDPECNFYRVLSVQDIKEWQRHGWINEQDPKGWFQWYIRYFLGRRTADDKRQCDRWHSFRRHLGQLIVNKHQERLKQRQACIQWGYNPEG
jgi:hypothetical protein